MQWHDMTDRQRHNTLIAMKNYGNSFIDHLSTAWRYADSTNRKKLEKAFPDIPERYGPGTVFYKEAR
jgi:hypothetical protein